MQNLDKRYYLSIMSQNNYINQRGKENKFIRLSPWIMLRPHLQPKLKIKLVTHDWTRGKMVVLLKHIKNTRWRENYINETQISI